MSKLNDDLQEFGKSALKGLVKFIIPKQFEDAVDKLSDVVGDVEDIIKNKPDKSDPSGNDISTPSEAQAMINEVNNESAIQ